MPLGGGGRGAGNAERRTIKRKKGCLFAVHEDHKDLWPHSTGLDCS